MYLDTVQYFRERKIDTVEMYDIQKNRYKSWEEIGMPDIVFHLNPHYKAFAESSNICNFPLSILNVYIPVSYTHLDVYKRQILYRQPDNDRSDCESGKNSCHEPAGICADTQYLADSEKNCI